MRLKNRKLRIWKADYLHHKYLWFNIEQAISRVLKDIQIQRPIVLDVGCGNKPYADLFEGCDYRGMDNTNNDADPEILGDALDIPLEKGSVDIVFCSQVIEHVPDPPTLVKECKRVLKPGGALILTAPFFWPLHEEPYDFHRFTKYGLGYLLNKAGFDTYEILPDGGDWVRIFLSLNLMLQKKYFFPIRIFLNLIGTVLDDMFKCESCPQNYTVIARVKKI